MTKTLKINTRYFLRIRQKHRMSLINILIHLNSRFHRKKRLKVIIIKIILYARLAELIKIFTNIFTKIPLNLFRNVKRVIKKIIQQNNSIMNRSRTYRSKMQYKFKILKMKNIHYFKNKQLKSNKIHKKIKQRIVKNFIIKLTIISKIKKLILQLKTKPISINNKTNKNSLHRKFHIAKMYI